MCGIFGIVSFTGVSPEALWSGTQRVEHRGPDDWGLVSLRPTVDSDPQARTWRFWEQRHEARNYRVGIGSRRLSILDRSAAGRQPMTLSDSQTWIVFNGAIYNYLELRAELSAEHRFKTRSDTEVLLAAYQKWESQCVKRLNGMFSFAIYDARQMKLFVARDRLGEKPFYYLRVKDKFVFGSELKQFFEEESFQPDVDHSALADFFLLYLQDHDERTLYKQIKQLRAAHWMQVNLSTLEVTGPVRYWQPEIADDFDDSRDHQFQENLADLLADSVRLRLRSDAPLGICMSGGLDSTTICSLAAREKNSLSLSAYTMGFPGFAEDELGDARHLARYLGVRHLDTSLSPEELLEELPDFVYIQDGPVGGPSILASRKVYKLARSDGTMVLLNGQGGDELFAGYSKFLFFWCEILCRRGRWLRLLSTAAACVARDGIENWSWMNARRYLPRILREHSGGIWKFALPELRRSISARADTGHNASLNQRLWKDLNELSLPCLLHWEDRNSMSVGTEVRLPFLDHRIIEAVLQSSAQVKISHGFTKYSLRKAIAHLPHQVRWQTKKRGFETPARQWFANNLARPLMEIFAKHDSLLGEFFDVKAIGEYLRAHQGPGTLTENDLFKLAATNVWLEQLGCETRKAERPSFREEAAVHDCHGS